MSVNDKWHYCHNSEVLVGSRAMRDRHLRLLGYIILQVSRHTASMFKCFRCCVLLVPLRGNLSHQEPLAQSFFSGVLPRAFQL